MDRYLWSCRESNPGPPTPLQVFYERSPRSVFGTVRPADGSGRLLAQNGVPFRAPSALGTASLLDNAGSGLAGETRADALPI